MGFSVTVPLALVGALTIVATRWPPLLRAVRSRVAVRIGRVALAALIVISLPEPMQSMTDIVNR